MGRKDDPDLDDVKTSDEFQEETIDGDDDGDLETDEEMRERQKNQTPKEKAKTVLEVIVDTLQAFS